MGADEMKKIAKIIAKALKHTQAAKALSGGFRKSQTLSDQVIFDGLKLEGFWLMQEFPLFQEIDLALLADNMLIR